MKQINEIKKDIIMFSISTLLSGVCWLLVAITLLADFAFLKNSPNLSITFNIVSIIFFILGCVFFIFSRHLCRKIRNFKKKTKFQLESLNADARQIYLSQVEKCALMNENGKFDNWKGVLYCIQMKIPEHSITKSIIEELEFENKRKDIYE